MSNVKFIVPKTTKGINEKGEEADMPQSKAGSIVEVPEADAKSFDDMGWERHKEGSKNK